MGVTDVTSNSLVAYFQRGTSMLYRKGELIVRPQESPEYVYYIETGFVKAYSITKYGEENLHVIRHSGEIFPLIWTFTDKHRDVAYEVIETATIWRQPKADYIAYITKNPEVAVAMMQLVMQAYHTFAEHVNTLEYRTVRERTISFLLACARRFGTTLPNGSVQINAPLRQQDIASSVNASRETASREMNALIRKKLVSIGNNRLIVIADPAILRKYL